MYYYTRFWAFEQNTEYLGRKQAGYSKLWRRTAGENERVLSISKKLSRTEHQICIRDKSNSLHKTNIDLIPITTKKHQ